MPERFRLYHGFDRDDERRLGGGRPDDTTSEAVCGDRAVAGEWRATTADRNGGD